ncbi:MAG: hypothetical protein IJ575_06860 [Selenomonadaceae bacterium]|nr:hypothetical protein [Selenomonadaceae bacterium]
MYVAGKARYLEEHGWTVYMFHNEHGYGESEIPSLTKYIYDFGFYEIIKPPYKYSDAERNQILDRMIALLHVDSTIENEIIIESYVSMYAMWAELIAERIHARHFFTTCEETYRGSDFQFYFENLDFFYFKHLRHEILGSNESIARLFNGYRGVTARSFEIPKDLNPAQEQDAIQDVENPEVEYKIRGDTVDFSIAYMGRTEKSYFPAVCNGIAEFAKNHPDKQIRFIIVGRFVFDNVLQSMNRVFIGIQNVEIVSLGNLSPIPRSLFSKLDVIISGAQTAIFAAYEGVPVVTTRVDSDLTEGVLFIDTSDAWYTRSPNQFQYAEALEKVLIRHEYVNRRPRLPERKPANWHYERTLEIQRNNDAPFEYFTAKFKQDLTRNWLALFPFRYVDRGAKVVLYGAGEISQDYQKQMKNYCELVAIVADDYKQYDQTVLPPEKLKELIYDEVVIAIMPNVPQIELTIQKIVNITGKMNNISYDWNPILAT